jgi:hypothetical protein
VVDAIGAGLIAGGAFLLLATFLGSDPGESFGEVERGRRERNAWLSSRVSAVATAVGAVLLLSRDGERWVALVAGCAAVAVCYLALAAKTRAEYQRVLVYVRHQASAGGSVTEYVDILLGLRADPTIDVPKVAVASRTIFPPPGPHLDLGGGPASRALPRAEERASWRWALTHPTGARNRGM